MHQTRALAGQVQSLANLRGIGQTFSIYTIVHGDYPFYPERRGMDGPGVITEEIFLSPPDENPVINLVFSPVFQLDQYWVGLRGMHNVAPWREHYATWVSPGSDREPGAPWFEPRDDRGFLRTAPPSYRYSNSFVARPRVWSEVGSVDEATDIGPTQPADVAFPSSKVVMFDAERAYLGGRTGSALMRPVLFADGAASARRDADAADPVQNRLFGVAPRRYHDTPMGLDGRDF